MFKRIKWKLFLKYIGFAFLGLVGFSGVVVGYVAITGGFNEKFVEVESLAFSRDEGVYSELDNNNNPVFVVYQDSTFKVLPSPQDATELDAKLEIKSGARLIDDILVIEKQEEEKDEQNQDEEPTILFERKNNEITIDDVKYVSANKYKEKQNTYAITIGEKFIIKFASNFAYDEERMISLYAEHLTSYCTSTIVLDAPVESFNLKYEKINAEADSEDNFFPSDSAYISIDETNGLLPTQALKTNNLTTLTNDYKYVEFELIGDSVNIASIDQIRTIDGVRKVKVDILEPGLVKVGCYVARTYEDEKYVLEIEEIISNTTSSQEEKDFYALLLKGGSLEDLQNLIETAQINIKENVYYNYSLKNGLIKNGEVQGLLKYAEIELTSNTLEIDSISSTKQVMNVGLFNSYNLTRDANSLNIKINPVEMAGSHYTSDSLDYLINDVKVYGGYFTQTDGQDVITINVDNQTRYIQKSDRYLNVTETFDTQNNRTWRLTVEDYKAGNNTNCLIIEYSTDNQSFYTFVPVVIEEYTIQDFKLLNGSEQILDLYHKSSAIQDTFNLNNISALLVDAQNNLLDPQISFENSDSDFKKLVFAVEDGNGNLTFNNGVIRIETTNNGQVITPLSKSATVNYLYALVMKTNKEGKFVDENNQVVNSLTSAMLNNQKLRLYKTIPQNSIIVSIYEELTFDENKIKNIYDKNNDIIDLTNPGEEQSYHIATEEYDITIKNGTIQNITMFLETSIYIKFSYNDIDAFNNAVRKNIFTFDFASGDLLILNYNESNGLLEVRANRVNDGLSTDNLIVNYKNNILLNIAFTTKDYLLTEMDLITNAVESSQQYVNVDVMLDVDEGYENGYKWVVDDGNFSDAGLVLTARFNPVNARNVEVNYMVITADDFNSLYDLTITADNFNQIVNMYGLVEDDSILQITGKQQTNKINEYNLTFNILKAGKVAVVAYSNSIKGNIYSKPVIIDIHYPEFVETINVGNYNASVKDKYIETKDGNDYRIIYASYENQKTDLFEFTSDEQDKFVAGIQEKILLEIIAEQEIQEAVNQNLFRFELEGDIEGCSIVDGKLITPVVMNERYIKVKLSTAFGYDFENQYYYYKLVPDIVVDCASNVNITKGDSDSDVYLIKLKLEDDEIVNDGGLLFITNNYELTNYRLDNDSMTTGNGSSSKAIRVIYLPKTYSFDGHGLQVFNKQLVEQSLGITLDQNNRYETSKYVYEFKFELELSEGDQINKISYNMTNATDLFKITFGSFTSSSYSATMTIRLLGKEYTVSYMIYNNI